MYTHEAPAYSRLIFGFVVFFSCTYRMYALPISKRRQKTTKWQWFIGAVTAKASSMTSIPVWEESKSIAFSMKLVPKGNNRG